MSDGQFVVWCECGFERWYDTHSSASAAQAGHTGCESDRPTWIDTEESYEEDDGPQTMVEATASGLALSALRALIDRYEPDREGAPIERFDDRWDLVQQARRKGVVYLAGDRLYDTGQERLMDVEDYNDARQAAREAAEDRGHEIEEPEQ